MVLGKLNIHRGIEEERRKKQRERERREKERKKVMEERSMNFGLILMIHTKNNSE